jgi:hypothetical protein
LGLVHPVTACARDAASSVAALDAAYVSRLIPMTSQARFIRPRGRKLCGIYNIIGRQRFDMRTGGTVASLTPMILPAACFVEIDGLVRILLECLEDIFMAGLADIRADISLGRGLSRTRHKPK